MYGRADGPDRDDHHSSAGRARYGYDRYYLNRPPSTPNYGYGSSYQIPPPQYTREYLTPREVPASEENSTIPKFSFDEDNHFKEYVILATAPTPPRESNEPSSSSHAAFSQLVHQSIEATEQILHAYERIGNSIEMITKIDAPTDVADYITGKIEISGSIQKAETAKNEIDARNRFLQALSNNLTNEIDSFFEPIDFPFNH